MNYKLVAMDMDGTLLNSKLSITVDTLFAIKKAMEKGVKFTISTGRPVIGIKKYIEILGIDTPVITYNGACVVDPITEEVLYTKNLENMDAKRILELGNQYGTLMCVWSNNTLYANRFEGKLENYRKLSGAIPKLITDYEELVNQGITKILWYDEVSRINQFVDEIDMNTFDCATSVTSQPYFLEFFNKDVNKGVALDYIGQKLGIKQEEIVAIGDGLNDLAMIEYAGLGVAMGNAHPKIKEVAKYITATNDEDGISDVIYELILN